MNVISFPIRQPVRFLVGGTSVGRLVSGAIDGLVGRPIGRWNRVAFDAGIRQLAVGRHTQPAMSGVGRQARIRDALDDVTVRDTWPALHD